MKLVRRFARTVAIATLLAACSGTGGGATPDATDVSVDAPTDPGSLGDTPDVTPTDVPDGATPDVLVDAELADAEVDAAEVVHATRVVETLGATAVEAGVGLTVITPDFEGYTDQNLNLIWDEGEPFDDKNQNDVLDTLYLGGMGLRQPTGVHDDLTARALALSFDGRLVVVLELDALGISIKRMDAIRARVLDDLPAGVDLTAERIWVANTHTHSAPDTIGIFGPEQIIEGNKMKGSYDEDYLALVVERGAEAVLAAVADLRPATLSATHALCGEGFVVDADLPLHTDPYVGILQAREAGGAAAIATFVTIANHPETLWTDDTEVSADFPHVLRERLETEVGGLALYASADAGLMQTPAKEGEPGFGRMQLIGDRYADAVLAALPAAVDLPAGATVTYGRATIPTELENVELYAGVDLGIVEGYKDYMYWIKKDPMCGKLGCFDLPVMALRLGDLVTLLSLPGETVPELVTGEITVPTELGSAVLYPDAPFEPVLKDHLATAERFLVGLCNAEVGYLFPKVTFAPSEIFSQRHGPGPNAAMTVFTGVAALLGEQNALH
jgi:hypothetical protein